MTSAVYGENKALAHWVETHFHEQVSFLQRLVAMPTDTPPGDNAGHARMVAEIIESWGWEVEHHPVPDHLVRANGLQSITNLVVRRRYGEGGPTIALNAHGDVVPPGDGWTQDPYGGAIKDGRLYGRAAAVSKSDFATYLYAVRALEAVYKPARGAIELHLTYDEEFGGLLGPGWLLASGLTRPDFAISAGFSYDIVTAHNGCLQLEVTLSGKAAHGATPEAGHDALHAATGVLQALYDLRSELATAPSATPGIGHPTLVVGQMNAGINTNVVPDRAVLKLDRRLIPEENAQKAEDQLHKTIHDAVAAFPGITVSIRRLLLAQPLRPLAGQQTMVDALLRSATAVFGPSVACSGSPLYTDARLYSEHGIPVVLYGAGPRTLAESNAKQADENLLLTDMQGATQVVAMALADLLATDSAIQTSR